MRIQISMGQVTILLGARLMFRGVPFHTIEKRDLSDQEILVLDELRHRILRIRDNLSATQRADRTFQFDLDISSEERKLYAEIIATDLAECVNHDCDLELHVGKRNDIEDLLAVFRS